MITFSARRLRSNSNKFYIYEAWNTKNSHLGQIQQSPFSKLPQIEDFTTLYSFTFLCALSQYRLLRLLKRAKTHWSTWQWCWSQWGVRIKPSPQHHKTVIYNGPNNFIDSPGGEQEAKALNSRLVKGSYFNLFFFFFILNLAHIFKSRDFTRRRNKSSPAMKPHHLIQVVSQPALWLSNIWEGVDEWGGKKNNKKMPKKKKKNTPPTGPPPLLPLQERGGATCSGVPQLKLPLPLEGKPFYCVPLR